MSARARKTRSGASGVKRENNEKNASAWIEVLESLKKYEDVAEWLNENFLDVRYTIDSLGNLVEVCLLAEYGGPTTWMCIADSEVKVTRYAPGREPETIEFRHPLAKEVFDEIERLVKDTLICK
jgi:hypothetical protein